MGILIIILVFVLTILAIPIVGIWYFVRSSTKETTYSIGPVVEITTERTETAPPTRNRPPPKTHEPETEETEPKKGVQKRRIRRNIDVWVKQPSNEFSGLLHIKLHYSEKGFLIPTTECDECGWVRNCRHLLQLLSGDFSEIDTKHTTEYALNVAKQWITNSMFPEIIVDYKRRLGNAEGDRELRLRLHRWMGVQIYSGVPLYHGAEVAA